MVAKSTEGVNLEAADEFVDRMADNPRLAKRFRHMSIKSAPLFSGSSIAARRIRCCRAGRRVDDLFVALRFGGIGPGRGRLAEVPTILIIIIV